MKFPYLFFLIRNWEKLSPLCPKVSNKNINKSIISPLNIKKKMKILIIIIIMLIIIIIEIPVQMKRIINKILLTITTMGKIRKIITTNNKIKTII
jgi:hypothetical protein